MSIDIVGNARAGVSHKDADGFLGGAMPKEESTRLLDFWIAVMELMRDERATYTAPLGGA